MKKKIIGFLVCMLFFVIALSNATSVTDSYEAEIEIFDSDQIITNGRGNNWSFTEVVSIGRDGSTDLPKLAVESDGTVHVVWQESIAAGIYNVYYKTKPSGGDWTTTELVNTESPGINAYGPHVAVDAIGTVHVAWDDESSYDGSGTDADIFYKEKPKDGSWTTTEVVSIESNGYSEVTSLAVEPDGTVHIIWWELGVSQEIFYKKKTPDGSWGPSEIVAFGPLEIDYLIGSLAVDSSGTVHVAWTEATDYGASGNDTDIFYKYKSSDGNWTSSEVVSTESYDSSRKSSLAVEPDGAVHVVWQDCTDYGDETGGIFYKYKPFGGSWTMTEFVSTGFGPGSFAPSLAVEPDGTVHVVWFNEADYGGSGTDADTFYRYKPTGESWKIAEVVSTESTSCSVFPKVDVDLDGTVHVVWLDGTWYGGSIGGIFYKKRQITTNNPPNPPNQPFGPTVGEEGVEYTFSSVAIDPDGDNISYRFYWRGRFHREYSDWTEFVPSGTMVNVSFSWTEHGNYEIGVRAKDSNNDVSDWSESFTITINETPELEIGIIEGWKPWLFSVHGRIRNVCYLELNDVHLSITVTGGILKLINKTNERIQDILPAGGGTSIDVKQIFGLGELTITVTASVFYDDEEIVATKTVTGFVIGPFVMISQE